MSEVLGIRNTTVKISNCKPGLHVYYYRMLGIRNTIVKILNCKLGLHVYTDKVPNGASTYYAYSQLLRVLCISCVRGTIV